MTRSQIIAELRRSAEFDRAPVFYVGQDAFTELMLMKMDGEWLADLNNDDTTTYFLLVAAAMEAQ